MSKKSELVIIADYSSANEPLSLNEFIEITHISADDINQYVQYDIIHPSVGRKNQWEFDVNHVRRLQRALRLQHDLELNIAGVAVVLDLLDEMENMRKQIELFERLYSR